MKRFLLFGFINIFVTSIINAQSFSVDNLLALANQPSKNINQYLWKKGFMPFRNSTDSAILSASFCSKMKNKTDADPKKIVEISLKDNCKFFTLHTTALNEYQEGLKNLAKAGFKYDTLKDISKVPSVIFQKANLTIKTASEMKDSALEYTFQLRVASVPDEIIYAEDLLQFNSHEFLVNYFGVENVKKDMYYLSEKELKKCSVLFSGTRRQAVFVWDDDINLNELAYVMVSNSLPTEGARKNDPLAGNNQWKMKNGICAGMELKDLLKINETDFDIYGNRSELAFLVKPNKEGKVDFTKTAIMFSCHECFDNKIFDRTTVSALDVAKANLPLRVFDVVLYPLRN